MWLIVLATTFIGSSSSNIRWSLIWLFPWSSLNSYVRSLDVFFTELHNKIDRVRLCALLLSKRFIWFSCISLWKRFQTFVPFVLWRNEIVVVNRFPNTKELFSNKYETAFASFFFDSLTRYTRYFPHCFHNDSFPWKIVWFPVFFWDWKKCHCRLLNANGILKSFIFSPLFSELCVNYLSFQWTFSIIEDEFRWTNWTLNLRFFDKFFIQNLLFPQRELTGNVEIHSK